MKIYTNRTVYEAAKERTRFLFQEFENIYVSTSGGKDSTVVLNIALEVAEELGRLPLKVCFVDQEAEWQAVVDYMRHIRDDPRIELYWYQMPIKISNSASFTEEWLYCWQEGEKWLRRKEPGAITENVFGTDRFKEMFGHIMDTYHHNEKACYIGGVRCEESPSRQLALTTDVTYKGRTWGKRFSKERDHYTFYPIYDWTTNDVWKYIHDSGVEYCKVYDYYYQKGVPVQNMRVSNLHHETAVHSLYVIEEFEKDTWNNLVERLGGIHASRSLSFADMFQAPKKLPWMFRSWQEYRDYLLDKLVVPDMQPKFAKVFDRYDEHYKGVIPAVSTQLAKVQVATILANDFHFTKLENFSTTPQAKSYRRFVTRGKIDVDYLTKWIPPDVLAKAKAEQGIVGDPKE